MESSKNRIIGFDLARAYILCGKSCVAMVDYKEAAKLANRVHHTSLEIHANHNFGLIYLDTENFIKAASEHPISLSSDKEGVSAYENYLGILGNEIISRFNIVTDYSVKKICLKPNTYFNKPFEFDLSGIKLKLESEQVTITSIFEESLAYKEGIREGDVIVSMNGLEKMPIETYRDMLKKENSTVVIKCADRKGIVKMASIKLKRLI